MQFFAFWANLQRVFLAKIMTILSILYLIDPYLKLGLALLKTPDDFQAVIIPLNPSHHPSLTNNKGTAAIKPDLPCLRLHNLRS